MRNTRSSRCISSRSAWLSASRYVTTGMSVRRHGFSGRVAGGVDKNVLEERLGRWLGTLLREIERVLNLRLDLLVELAQCLFRQLALLFHVHAQEYDRIALLPLLELRLRPIRAADRV